MLHGWLGIRFAKHLDLRTKSIRVPYCFKLIPWIGPSTWPIESDSTPPLEPTKYAWPFVVACKNTWYDSWLATWRVQFAWSTLSIFIFVLLVMVRLIWFQHIPLWKLQGLVYMISRFRLLIIQVRMFCREKKQFTRKSLFFYVTFVNLIEVEEYSLVIMYSLSYITLSTLTRMESMVYL